MEHRVRWRVLIIVEYEYERWFKLPAKFFKISASERLYAGNMSGSQHRQWFIISGRRMENGLPQVMKKGSGVSITFIYLVPQTG